MAEYKMGFIGTGNMGSALARAAASPRSANMVLLGAAAPFIDLEAEKIEEGIRSVFGAKGDKIVDMNITAFRAGLKLTRELLEKRK